MSKYDDDEELCPTCGKPEHKIGERCKLEDIVTNTDKGRPVNDDK